jgi:DNA/RNA endonuclease YhcR with UshA esterase domain
VKESTLLKASLIGSAIGIIGLILFVQDIDIARVDDSPPESSIRIQGEITKLTQLDNVVFVEVSGVETVSTKVVIFPDSEVLLKQGDVVEVIGQVTSYQGKKEIIASEVLKTS